MAVAESDMKSYDLWSCFCLFDECCISKSKQETHKQLVKRCFEHAHKMCWLVKNIEDYKKEQRYVCCINRVGRIIENITITAPQHDDVTHMCLKNTEGGNTNCFYFYQEGMVDLHGFCISCKIYFMSLDEFNLKKIVIANGVFN